MSASFPNTFNVGTDQSITIFNSSTGMSATLDGKRTNFTPEATDKVIKTSPVDGHGIPDHRVVADGWQGTIETYKSTPDFSQLYALLEASYYLGAPQSYFTITETIRDPQAGGVMERNQYIGVAFHGYKPGAWTKDSDVKVTVSWVAAQRIDLLA